MNTNYSPMIVVDHDGHSRLYETPYNPRHPYVEYPTPSKLEALECNYWQNPNVTHNLLSLPHSSAVCASRLDSAQTAPSSTHASLESLIPVHVTQMNAAPSTTSSSSSTTISAMHHHHHIHQHLYPTGTVTPSNDPPHWYNAVEYPSPTSSYCPYTYANNTCYDQTQWSTPNSTMPMKFETPYSPTSYAESSHQLDQPSYVDSKEEPSDYADDRLNCCKIPFTPVPPKNPTNGKTRTRDKYRIVYNDRQRYELENEYNKTKYISIPRKAALSSSLALSERQIKIWFQNRRAKERKLGKKRQETCPRPLNHSNDADSPSDDETESPPYYSHYM